MKQAVSVAVGLMLGLSALATQASAQSYTATKVFDADSHVTTGYTGLGGYCYSNCNEVDTRYTPLGLSDANVAFASRSIDQYYSRARDLVVWDQGTVKPGYGYALYAGQAIPGYVAASNAGAVPMFPSGDNYVAPVANDVVSFLNGVSNSGRLLAGAYNPLIAPGFPSDNIAVPIANAKPSNDLYVSAVGGGSWTKISHDPNSNYLIGADVNNQGQAVGYAVDADRHAHAFYTGADAGPLQSVNIDGVTDSTFFSVNDLGVAAGIMRLSADGSWHTFTYDTQSGLLKDLGLDPAGGGMNGNGSVLLKINDAGQIVRGSSLYDPLSGNWLQPSAAGLSDTLTLYDINNQGNILAKGISGVYILQAVPEPGTTALTGLGLLGIALAARKKRRTAKAC